MNSIATSLHSTLYSWEPAAQKMQQDGSAHFLILHWRYKILYLQTKCYSHGWDLIFHCTSRTVRIQQGIFGIAPRDSIQLWGMYQLQMRKEEICQCHSFFSIFFVAFFASFTSLDFFMKILSNFLDEQHLVVNITWMIT